MKLLILGGCGNIGTECTKDLLLTAREFHEIGVADLNIEKARTFVVGLHDDRVRALRVDVSDMDSLIKLIEGYDLILNLTPGPYTLIAMRATITARKNYLDLGSHGHIAKQLVLDAQAKEAGVTICLGCGASPGITNVLVRYAANQMETITRASIAFAKFNHLSASEGVLERLLEEFDPEGLRYYYDSGSFVQVEPFVEATKVEFEAPIGLREVYHVPHTEAHTLPYFIKSLERVEVRASWRAETFSIMNSLLKAGLLDKQVIDVKGAKVTPKDVVRTVLSRRAPPQDPGIWAYYLWVECEGQERGRKIVRRYRTRHPGMDRWGRQSVAKMVGIPASIGARMMALRSDLPRGVLAPEACFEPEAFVRELGRREIVCVEQVLAENQLG